MLSRLRGDHSSLMQRGVVVLMVFALVNQLLALLRDRLLASTFGAGSELDVYFAAFRFPDLLFYALVSLGATMFIAIPLLSRRAQEEGEEGAMRFVCRWSTLLAAVGLAGAALLWLGAPWLAREVFSSFRPSEQETLIVLTRILSVQPLFLALAALWIAVAQWKGAYLLYGVAPIVYTLGVMGGVLIGAPLAGVVGVGVGVTMGAAAQAALAGWWLRREGFSCAPRFPSLRAVGEILRLSVPRGITLAVGQGLLLVVAVVGGFLAEGSVAAFFLAWSLVNIPLSLLVAPYVTASFPLLARDAAAKNWQEVADTIARTTRAALWWTLFAVAAFIVLRAQIVRVIYGAGSFDWEDTRLTAATLAILALSMPAQMFVLLFARSWYALERATLPLAAAVGGGAVGIAVGGALFALAAYSPAFLTALAKLTRLEGISDPRIVLVAAAYSSALLAQAIFLFVPLIRRFPSLVGEISDTLWRSALAAIGASVAMYVALHSIVAFVSLETFWGVLAQGAGAGIVGFTVYFLLSRMLKVREATEALTLARALLWR